MGETQKNIAEGIISISELSRVERGEREIDYFTLQALFERLGKSIDKFEIAMSVNEYDAISYRVQIEQSIEKWDAGKLSEQLADYYTYNDEKRPIHRQYAAMLQAILSYMKDKDYVSCMHGMERAIACTLEGPWIQLVRRGQRFCNQEIRIILMYVYCLWKQGNTDGLTGQLEELCRHILLYNTDMEEQVKIYPHCTWLLGQLYLSQDKVAEAYAACQKGMDSLRENGSLNPLRQMLELMGACLEKMGKQTELELCRKYHKTFLFLYEAAEAELEPDMMVALMKSSFQGEFVITNELLKDLRKANGISQETLCADICSQETLSRIEQGKRSPNKKKLYQMLKRLGMERENYYGFVRTDEYSLYEKVRQYNRSSPRNNYEEAGLLLDEIEGGLDMTIPLNRQFIGMGRINLQTGKGELSKEQANRKLWELLSLTMPPTDAGRLVYRQPFRTEYILWNCIGINLRMDNRITEALHIYKELTECYKRSRVLMQHHAVSILTLYLNYAGFLEENNELDKAEAIAREGLLQMIKCCRGDSAGYVLANLSLVYGKRGMPEREEAYLRNGYCIGRFYNKKDAMEKVRTAYKEKFHREIDF